MPRRLLRVGLTGGGGVKQFGCGGSSCCPGERPFPLDKGKGKLNEIRLPSGSEYLRAAIQNAEAVGPILIEPSNGEIFVA